MIWLSMTHDLAYLVPESVKHHGVQTDYQDKGQEVAQDEETCLESVIWLSFNLLLEKFKQTLNCFNVKYVNVKSLNI